MGFQISSIYFQSINIYNQRVQSWLYLGSHQSWNVWSICPFVSTCLTPSLSLSVCPSAPHLHTLIRRLSQTCKSLSCPAQSSREIYIEDSPTDSTTSSLPGGRKVQAALRCWINGFLSGFSCLNPAKLLNGFNLAELCY